MARETQTANIATLVDSFLPVRWDYDSGLAVLAGADCAPVARELARRGQRRIVAFVPRGVQEPRLADSAFVVRRPEEVLDAVLAMPGGVPSNAVIRSFGDGSVSREELKELANAVKQAVRVKQMHVETLDAFGQAWVENGIANLPRLAELPAVDALDGAFAGQPCVIVSPGPSLAKNVELLRRLEGRALVVTCSHALHALRGAGVVPDLVLAADAADLEPHFRGHEFGKIGALLVGATCRGEVFSYPERHVVSFAGNSFVDDWLFEALGADGRLPSGGSVACTALSLALRMGCDEIAFVGQDLAFPGMRYYVDSSLDGAARMRVAEDGSSFQLERFRAPAEGEEPRAEMCRREDLLEVPAWGGGVVHTSNRFRNFLTWFSSTASAQAERARFFNATEGGARIEGMEHVPLAHLVERWGDRELDSRAVLDERLALDAVAARAASVERRVSEMLPALRECEALARACTELARAARRRPSLLGALTEKERELSAALAPIQFVSVIAQRDIRAAQERAERAKSMDENLAAAQKLFAVIERAGQTLREPLERCVAGLRPAA